MGLETKILESAARQAEGAPISAKQLLHLGSRAAIDQALSRLFRRGELLRVARGLYTLPIQTRFGKRPPSVESFVLGLAASRGEVIVSHGTAAANALGLTTQVPVRNVYLTSGPSRKLLLGKQTIELRHASQRLLAEPESRASVAIRALEWLGKERAAGALPKLRRQIGEQQFQEIARARSRMREWLASQVSQQLLSSAHG